MNLKDFYFSPKGRLNRKDFLLKFYGPFLMIYYIPLLFAETGFVEWAYDTLGGGLFGMLGLLWMVLFLALLWPYCTTLIKRFHDFDKSWKFILVYHAALFSWAAFLLFVILFLSVTVHLSNFKFLEAIDNPDFFYFLSLLGFGLGLIWPLYIPGTKGDNKYGQPT